MKNTWSSMKTICWQLSDNTQQCTYDVEQPDAVFRVETSIFFNRWWLCSAFWNDILNNEEFLNPAIYIFMAVIIISLFLFHLVWKRDLLCWHVFKECKLLLCQSAQPRWTAAAVWGELVAVFWGQIKCCVSPVKWLLKTIYRGGYVPIPSYI